MSRSRLSLFNYDLLRELCEHCRKERFHFVPIGDAPATAACKQCGRDTTKLADMSDTAVMRLVTQPNGDVVVVQVNRA
jgi:NMD protein affecting ribosome stability and mRNA decay